MVPILRSAQFAGIHRRWLPLFTVRSVLLSLGALLVGASLLEASVQTSPPPAPGTPGETSTASLSERTREVVKSYESSLAAFKAWDVQLDVVLYGSSGEEVTSETVRWIRRGKLERFSIRRFFEEDPKTGKFLKVPAPASTRETFYDLTEVRVLSGWDPQRPPKLPLTPQKDGAEDFARTNCGIVPRPQVDFHVGQGPPLLLLFTITRHSLREMARESTSMAGEPLPSGLYKITFKHPSAGLIHCYLDPNAGYLIKRIEFPDHGRERRVAEFAEPQPGLFFPRRVEFFESGRKTIEARVVALKVNEPVEDADLRLDFPAGARVDDLVNGKIHIWGADGKPQHSFANIDQYVDWLKAVTGSESGGASARAAPSSIFFFVNIGLIVVIVVLLYLRRRYNRAS